MLRNIMLAASAVSLFATATPALAQTAAPAASVPAPVTTPAAPRATRSTSYCAPVSQTECPNTPGCAWKDAETWVRQGDGKERHSSARCSFNAKLARDAIGKQLLA